MYIEKLKIFPKPRNFSRKPSLWAKPRLTAAESWLMLILTFVLSTVLWVNTLKLLFMENLQCKMHRMNL